uniref:Uncharacterized protein n=1 Tax=Aetherobacter rufus TaxID=888831 RepID=A0A3Q8I222_9BACT|nr:hypothetical protein [Aetherobacter rufus]
MVGHVFAYPVAVVWAMASIPLAIHLFIDEIDLLPDEEAIGQLVVRRVVWPAGAAFVLVHLASLLWAFAADPALGFARFLKALAGTAAIGALLGIASWSWLMLR